MIKPTGRVTIDVAAAESGDIQLTVARACANPAVLQLIDQILDEIARRYPKVTIRDVQVGQRKRGGPIGMPQEQRLKIVKGWFGVQGQMKETHYARSQGISPSTLRRWVQELGQAGKL